MVPSSYARSLDSSEHKSIYICAELSRRSDMERPASTLGPAQSRDRPNLAHVANYGNPPRSRRHCKSTSIHVVFFLWKAKGSDTIEALAFPVVEEIENSLSSRSTLTADPPLALSLRLRSETSDLHHDIEARLGFPDSIQDLAAYRACLISYYRLYSPIESSLAAYPDWEAYGIRLQERLQLPRLLHDLEALDVEPASCPAAGPAWVPPMPDFPHALGVFYVLEGSTLGAQFILRRLRTVLGSQIDGADAFFGGHAASSGAMWNRARQAIDAYGEGHPESCDDVIEGASSTFQAVGRWMTRHE